MPFNVYKLRFPWFALAAFVGASLVTGNASATCPSMANAGVCPSACCCCEPTESATAIRDTAEPATARPHLPSQDRNVCPDNFECNCRPQAPAAPRPKERRAEESRPDSGRSTEAGWLALGGVFRPFIGRVLPTSSPPQELPSISIILGF